MVSKTFKTLVAAPVKLPFLGKCAGSLKMSENPLIHRWFGISAEVPSLGHYRRSTPFRFEIKLDLDRLGEIVFEGEKFLREDSALAA